MRTCPCAGAGNLSGKGYAVWYGEYVQMFFGESSIILVAGFAIVLNLILPKDKTDQEVEAEYIREISQTEEDGAASAKAHEVETA